MLTDQTFTYGPEVQEQAIAFFAALSIPKHHYETQGQAMTAARSIAMDTKHRMYVYPEYREDSMYGYPVTFTLWHIRLGKGALQ